MRVKAAEGQSKVIRLSISNPFSSLRHWVPFKQANDKAVIQDNSVCTEQRDSHGVEIRHCSLSVDNETKKVWASEHLFPSFPPSSAMKRVCLHTCVAIRVYQVQVILQKMQLKSLPRHNVNGTTFCVVVDTAKTLM